MEINYNSGANGKKKQTNEVIGMGIDLENLTETDIQKDAFHYVSKKEDTNPKRVVRGEKSAYMELRAFNALHKQKQTESPKGTVGPTVPMEIRISQLSLFPGIY